MEELKILKQWVLHKKKVPYSINGYRASPTKPTTWASYEDVKNMLQKYPSKYDGIGFVFTESDDYVGIDLDYGIDESIREDIINTLDSYTEISPSGKGYHIIVKGKKTAEANRKDHLEIYDHARYFTITGNIVNGKDKIEERQEALDLVCEKYLSKPQETAGQEDTAANSLDDDKLIDMAKKAKNGANFKRLMDGDTTGYQSESEADLALCGMLAFWTGKLPTQMDRIFRNSGLYRGKWDEKRGLKTYGQMTIEQAIKGCNDVYNIHGFVIDGANGKLYLPDFREKNNGEKTFLFTSGNTEALLRHLNIFLKWDVIKRKIVIEQPGKSMPRTNEPNIDNLEVFLTDKLKMIGIRPNLNELKAQLVFIAYKNSFNAVSDFLIENSKRQVKTNAVEEYLNCFQYGKDEEFCKLLMRKWFVQTVALMFNDKGRYGADGVLTFIGGQGIGKTRSLAKPFISVVPESYYQAEATYNTSKDSLIQNTSFWVVEFSEMLRSFKDVETFKAFITSPNDIIRLPYGRSAGDYPRYTSYCGSTNDESFLKDTSNRRFWTVRLLSIDFDKINRIDFFDFWAIIYAEFKQKGQSGFRLTSEERAKLELVNTNYRLRSNEEIIIMERLNWGADRDSWKYKTSTEIAEELSTKSQKLLPAKVGRAMTAIGYSSSSDGLPKKILDGFSAYLVPPKIYYRL